MISCRHARHLFDSYLDGELSPGLRAELHAHRLACPDCSHQLAILEACADVIRTDRREPTLHADFTDRLMVAFADRKPVPVYRWRRIAVYAGSPLAAAAVLVFAFMAWFEPARHGPTAIAARSEKLPGSVMQNVLENSGRVLTAAEKKALDETRPLSQEEVLKGWLVWLRPAMDGANTALGQAQQNASQLAEFVRVRIAPPEVLFAAEQSDQAARETRITNDESSDLRFDTERTPAEHTEQPEPTDAGQPIDVM